MDLWKNNHNYNTKAFTLFEVLVSLIILSMTISGVTKLLKDSNDIEIYYELIDAQNSFNEFGIVNDTKNIKFK